jgi:hypothetical protein
VASEGVSGFEAADIERHRWLVRVDIAIPLERVREISDRCGQFGWGFRPADPDRTGLTGDEYPVAVDVPMIGAKAGVRGSASRGALVKLGRTGVPVHLERADIVEAARPGRVREFRTYSAFPDRDTRSGLAIWHRIRIYSGARDCA